MLIIFAFISSELVLSSLYINYILNYEFILLKHNQNQYVDKLQQFIVYLFIIYLLIIIYFI
jgi:hypothetical protein